MPNAEPLRVPKFWRIREPAGFYIKHPEPGRVRRGDSARLVDTAVWVFCRDGASAHRFTKASKAQAVCDDINARFRMNCVIEEFEDPANPLDTSQTTH